jgi:DNA mismatch repair protein MutL
MPPCRIRVLSAELADQIAAGEVVERPASVVKELVENALDAGAARVEVEIERGGLQRIRVSDDGHGMTEEEAHLALRRHATSKLTAVDDLFRLSTLGFRGEALPAIAGVSRLELTTRQSDADGAYRLTVRGGVVGEARTVGAPAGTTVEVRDLFFNVPARLKFVKTIPTEAAHVYDAVLHLALAFPEVHFRLRSDGRSALDLPPHASGLERSRAALGRAGRPIALEPGRGAEGPLEVEAHLGAPDAAGPTSRGVCVLVNQRFVRDRGLQRALESGYGARLAVGRHPVAVLHVRVPPGAVDVNVHPQKLEIRLQRPQEVYAAVRHVVDAAVARAGWPEVVRAAEHRVDYEGAAEPVAEAPRLFAASAPSLFDDVPAAWGAERPPHEAFDAPLDLGTLGYLGQLDRSYLVCATRGALVLVDQHAADERARLHRLAERFDTGALPAEALLVPLGCEVPTELFAELERARPLLHRIGFRIEGYGAGAASLHAIPEGLGEASGEALLDALAAIATAARSGDAIEGAALKWLACQTALRPGTALSDETARALIASLDGLDLEAEQPHGRPVHVRLTLGDIERRFGSR